jgi:hypothetical protein
MVLLKTEKVAVLGFLHQILDVLLFYILDDA